jgi:hypothetical protein
MRIRLKATSTWSLLLCSLAHANYVPYTKLTPDESEEIYQECIDQHQYLGIGVDLSIDGTRM